MGCGDFGGFCYAEVEVLNVFPKSIDSGCRDWTGGVHREIPKDCITMLVRKRPKVDYGLLAISQADESTSRIRWIIVRESFNELFPNSWYGATLNLRRQLSQPPDSLIGILPSSNPPPHPPPLNPTRPSVDSYMAAIIIKAPLHIPFHCHQILTLIITTSSKP